MNQIQVQILTLLSNALFNSHKPVEITTPNALITEASAQAVLPLTVQDNIPAAKTQINAILVNGR